MSWFEHFAWRALPPHHFTAPELHLRLGGTVHLTMMRSDEATEIIVTGDTHRIHGGLYVAAVSSSSATIALGDPSNQHGSGIANTGYLDTTPREIHTIDASAQSSNPIYAATSRRANLRMVITVPTGTIVKIERV